MDMLLNSYFDIIADMYDEAVTFCSSVAELRV